MLKFSWKLENPACRELISRCKFSDPRFYTLSMAKRAPKNILTVIYEYTAKNFRARADKREKKTLRRDRVKENWILPRSFIDANILFDLDRPQHASRPTTSIRNNWPSADPPSRDDTSQITEFQTRLSNFHIFSSAMQWKYCARSVSRDNITGIYGNPCAPVTFESRELSHSLTHVCLPQYRA